MVNRIKGMIEKIKGTYFFHGEEIDVEEAREIIAAARERIEASMKERDLLEVMAHTMSGCVWIKSYDFLMQQHTYEFANYSLCEKFLCLDADCLLDCTAHVKGKSDIDLINEYQEKKKKQHTFSDLCSETDEHCVEQAILWDHTKGQRGSKSCRYLESGYIGEKVVLFDVTKTPVFKEGEKWCWNTHTYLVGSAQEVLNCCDSIYSMGLKLIEEGKAEKLGTGVIWVYNTSEPNCYLVEKDLKGE